MNELSRTIESGFTHYFEDFSHRVHQLAGELDDEQFWAKPHPYGNSFGNLVLHLNGNLNFYIGTQIELTGYVRNRDLEFAENTTTTKAEALAALTETVSMVVAALRKQEDADWSRAYSAPGVDDVHDRFSIFLRCCAHFHHHLGQMIYIVKGWKNQH